MCNLQAENVQGIRQNIEPLLVNINIAVNGFRVHVDSENISIDDQIALKRYHASELRPTFDLTACIN